MPTGSNLALHGRTSDGKGYTIDLDALPVGEFNGRLTLRAIEPSNREPSAA